MAGVASPTPLNILAGIAGQGGTPNLAFFAPIGTALPSDPSTALDPAYLTAGYCSTNGLAISTNISTQDIAAFGITVPARVLVTSATKTGTVSFLETNPVSQAVYRRLPLPGQTGGPTADTTGAMTLAEGPARIASYVGVFIATDGANIIRKVAPNIAVTGIADETIAQNSSVEYGVTFTLLPDADGNTLYSYYLVPNLGTTAPAWQANHAYALNDQATLSGGAVVKATTAGTSGATEPAAPAAVGGTVVDNTVTWTRTA